MLTYCTNVHPGETLAQVQESLERWSRPLVDRLRARSTWPEPFPLGLWLSAQAVQELATESAVEGFRLWLADRGFVAATLNCFPYGGFHAAEIKEAVFQPDWRTEDRLDYTQAAATVLAGLMPNGAVAAISTSSGTLKRWADTAADRDAMAVQMVRAAAHFARLADSTGREIVLSLEPEPTSTLETTPEVLDFFRSHVWSGAGRATAAEVGLGEEELRRHLGLCYDTCHQAVEFEDVGESLQQLEEAGVRIGKVQLSNAITVPDGSPEGFAELARYDEPRYLHQTFARRGPAIEGYSDLGDFLAGGPAAAFDEARVHFHVPIHQERLGAHLKTTQRAMLQAIDALVGAEQTELFEVETYTFPVLLDAAPDAVGDLLLDGLQAELEFARAALEERG